MSEEAGMVNVYRCGSCGGKTVTKNRDAGTTPFMLSCRVTPGCKGMAQSEFYRTRQDQSPDVIFIKPSDDELRAFLREYPDHVLAIREHVRMGGLLDVRAPERVN